MPAVAAAWCLALGCPPPVLAQADQGEVVFRHALDDSPLDMTYRPEQTITLAVKQFHETAENPYAGNEQAIADGKALYMANCSACHMPDATGRIGPNLIDEEVHYPRVSTDQGMFEVIYGGAAGAMQAFGMRIDQDEILKIMTYLGSLQQSPGGGGAQGPGS